MNGYMGQLKGPFKANEDLFKKIEENSFGPVISVTHLGVQAEEGTKVFINNKEIEIGKRRRYEIRNVEVNSLFFPTDVNNNTIIDYVINKDENDENQNKLTEKDFEYSARASKSVMPHSARKSFITKVPQRVADSTLTPSQTDKEII